MISRREWLAGMVGAAGAWVVHSQGMEALAAPPKLGFRPDGVLIESHVHLVSDEPSRFPFSTVAPYHPRPLPVQEYVKFAAEAGINHTVIVSPEPYQDDMSYMEYCFSQEPSKGFFKGVCLFDPISPATPNRLQELVRRNPGRIVALRIHEYLPHQAGTAYPTSGPIRERNLMDPQMLATWRAAHDLGMGILLQLIPQYAQQIGELAAKLPSMPVYLDHLARPAEGTAEEYEQVLKLAHLPNVYMKYTTTGVQSAATAAIRQAQGLPPVVERAESAAPAIGTQRGEAQPGTGRGQRGPGEAYPFPSAKPLVKRVYDAFGADRIMWGELGSNVDAFEKAVNLLNMMFDFAPETERKKIRGLTAQKLFAFS